jgi:hypothetical protein
MITSMQSTPCLQIYMQYIVDPVHQERGQNPDTGFKFVLLTDRYGVVGSREWISIGILKIDPKK